MTDTPTCACGQPAPTSTICRACTARLRRDLELVPELRRQLDLSLSRQSAHGAHDGGRSADKPLPYDVGASDALDMLTAALRRAARALGAPAHDVVGDALRAWERLDDLAQHPEADRMAADIGSAVAKARRTIDRRPERLFAGPCDGHGYTIREQGAPERGCGDWLYARPEARDVRCRSCRTGYDVEMRRSWMLEAAEDYLANAATLSRFVSRLGHPVKGATLRQWKRRGRLEQRGTDADGHPLYRIGDVLDLLHGEAVRHADPATSNGV